MVAERVGQCVFVRLAGLRVPAAIAAGEHAVHSGRLFDHHDRGKQDRNQRFGDDAHGCLDRADGAAPARRCKAIDEPV